MKRVVFFMSVSLDGFFEGPNHELDWHLVDDEFNAHAVAMLKAADTLIMGRITYELMAGYWPTATGDYPAVAELMNNTPKLVFSRTLKSVDWQNSRLATGSIADEVARLKQAPGDGLIHVGGNELAMEFLEKGLIDEIRIILTPIVLGSGNSLFAGLQKRCSLNLLSTRV